MDSRVSFVYHWMPLAMKAVNRRRRKCLLSPCFSTIYNKAAFKWRIIFYPNGQPSALKDNSSIYLQLIHWPWMKSRYTVEADVELELFSAVDDNTKWCSAFNATFCSSDGRTALVSGSKFFGANLKHASDVLFKVSGDRLIFRCILHIPVSEFFKFDKDTIHTVSSFSGKDGILGSVSLEPVSDLTREVKMYAKGGQPDITVISNDDKSYLCHMEILCRRSNVFVNMFKLKDTFKERVESCIKFHDIDGDTLNEFIAYLYNGCLSEKAKALSPKLLYAAHKYMISDLVSLCKPLCSSIMMETKVTKDNVWPLLQYANMYDLDDLKQIALETIIMNYEFCLKSQEFEEIRKKKPDLLTSILHFVCGRAILGMGCLANY